MRYGSSGHSILTFGSIYWRINEKYPRAIPMLDVAAEKSVRVEPHMSTREAREERG